MNFEKKKPETNHLRLSLQPLTVATSRSWRGWVAAGSTESVSGKNKKTERGGFEPPKAFDLTRLPIVHLRPLGHLSNSTANYIRKAFDSSSSATLLLQEHCIVYWEVDYFPFFLDLSVVAKNNGLFYIVVLVFYKRVESAVY